AIRTLRVWQIGLGSDFSIESGSPSVRHDAHNCQPPRIRAVRHAIDKSLANRVLIREIPPGKCLVDHYNARGSRFVVTGELSSPEQWDSHYSKVVLADRIYWNFYLLTGREGRPALDGEVR